MGMEEEELKFIYPLLLFIGWFVTTNGQVHVKGIVTRGSDGKPLAGASVYFEHTSVGTVTDGAGAFSLSISANGSQQLVISYIGFQRHIENIAANTAEHNLTITLDEKKTTLQEVVVVAESKNGWQKWGQLFTDLFIGTSAYARHCTLLNKEKLRFVFAKGANTLHVYADEPLILENLALGYSIRIDLEKFNYDFNKKYLFYEIHSFYQQLKPESISDVKKWQKNRLDVYTGSAMHFYRTLFDSSYMQQGFKIHRFNTAMLAKWERISVLYQQHSLNNDSLKYYNKILKQGPPPETIDPEPLQFHEFASIQDSAAIVLNFNGKLFVTYTGKEAPHEYLLNEGIIAAPGQPPIHATQAMLKPVSYLTLTDKVPVEVYKSGAIKNDDLLITGYFAWLNKMATSLPLDYDPQQVLLKTGNK